MTRANCLGGLAALTLAGLLLLSWFGLGGQPSPVRPLWDALDRHVFFALNGTLAEGDTWRLLWAAANTRIKDAVSALLFALIFSVYIVRGGWASLALRSAQGLFVLLYTVLVLNLSSNVIFTFDRASPSLVLEPAYRIAGLLGDIKVKDTSGSSFPGDHGTAVFLFTTLIGYFCGRWYGLVAASLAALLVLPRLVGGAHWLTDLAIGSTSIALVAGAIAVATPLAAGVSALMARPIASLLRLGVRFGVLPERAAPG